MDWQRAIERNSALLKRILAELLVMAGMRAGGSASPPDETDASAGHGGEALPEPREDAAGALPRHQHRAVLRLLRPAESAARRLIIVLARDMVATLPPPRARRQNRPATIARNSGGTGIVMPRHAADHVRPATPAPRALSLPLLDPARRNLLGHRPARSRISVPRISVPGFTTPLAVAAYRPPAPNDLLDATRIRLRIRALGNALDDLPAQARRFARCQARRDALAARMKEHRGNRRTCRLVPIRSGPAYGAHKGSRRRAHPVDEVLLDLHYFAREALERRDTS